MADLGWYLRRLSRMGPGEIVARVHDRATIETWRRRPGLLGRLPTDQVLAQRRAPAALPVGTVDAVDPAARERLIAAAQQLMDGHTVLLGVQRDDLESPDWHWDPATGRRAPHDAFAFDVPYRDQDAVGNVKQLWELSRHQHLTVLAAAFACTGDTRYAERVGDHLKSWWAASPPLRGVHWVSGIELGLRLISWAWVRRLLDGWSGASGLFEDNPEAVRQIHAHQRWLSALPSVGSSANNHAVAEAAGQVVAACAFDWFVDSASRRAAAIARLDRELAANTFSSGLNRELATEYHGLVAELGLLAVAEADAANLAVPESLVRSLIRSLDALAAIVDCRGRPPRQGDGDDGHGLLVDGDGGVRRWSSLLDTGRTVFGACPWWPAPAAGDLRSVCLAALVRPRPGLAGRPSSRPFHFADAGLTVLRAHPPALDAELWCRIDGGPHGFGTIAAHAHADALSVEVRLDGVDVLADPGTYCYHGEPAWRGYFRSTLGHNCLQIGGLDQSESGGPFLWMRHARARVLTARQELDGLGEWVGEHEGYLRRFGVGHRRSVLLHPQEGTVEIHDQVQGRECEARLAFHFGPLVHLVFDEVRAELSWTVEGHCRRAAIDLPAAMRWTAQRGQVGPPRGWYSERFGCRVPSWTLTGTGRVGGVAAPLRTVLRFAE